MCLRMVRFRQRVRRGCPAFPGFVPPSGRYDRAGSSGCFDSGQWERKQPIRPFQTSPDPSRNESRFSGPSPEGGEQLLHQALMEGIVAKYPHCREPNRDGKYHLLALFYDHWRPIGCECFQCFRDFRFHHVSDAVCCDQAVSEAISVN